MRAKQEKILKIVITAVMVILGLICIYPFIFMLSSSFKPSGDVLSTPLQIIPSNFTMMNFETLFNNEFYDFFQWFGNTVVMTGLTLILKFFVITITAYGFAKMKFPGRDAIFLVLLAGLMIPSDIMIMPRYIIFKNLGILNTMWSLILPAAVDVYFVFLLRQAFVAVPEALSEAARIDGCSHFTIYRRIILPLCMPQVSTMLLFSFVWSWNDYMGPYLYIDDLGRYQAVRLGPGAGLRRPDGRRDAGPDPGHRGLLPLPEVLRRGHHRRRSQRLIF